MGCCTMPGHHVGDVLQVISPAVKLSQQVAAMKQEMMTSMTKYITQHQLAADEGKVWLRKVGPDSTGAFLISPI